MAEVAMFRYEKVISCGLHARALPTQKTEAKVACKVLNIMTGFGMPVSRRIALTSARKAEIRPLPHFCTKVADNATTGAVGMSIGRTDTGPVVLTRKPCSVADRAPFRPDTVAFEPSQP
ncbi:hypothetical protein N825_29955 [Skermanella stibiiresistens SB22]|uniref:Uncharacterized protein n=2 Tax=Skermanella TaxID=204447 RepID=W9GQM5_9PROT|nr:hypothetical protein N825_29955 [Skermanella stibiiresistens SB22]